MILDIIFFAFNALIFFRYADLLSHWGITRCAEKIVFAYLLTMIQIIATLLFLGTIGWLYPLATIVLNGIILLALPYFSHPTSSPVSKDGAWKEIIKPLSNKVILSMAAIVLGWLLICAYFLPPRTVDDMTYHLPFIYESIQRGQWTLLPTNLRIHFAYPMNAEILFSWSVLFLGDTRWVDASQIPIGIWTSGLMYLFGRHFGLHRAKAFFLAGLFFLTPIVMAQMGTNYIDLSSAGFLLSSLYLTIRFLITTKKIYTRLAFLSIGAMMGMKYHLLFWGFILGLVLMLTLIRKRRGRDFFFGLLAVGVLGLGWHLRNWRLFSDWLYPARETAPYWEIGHPSISEMFISIPNKLELIFITLVNNGTVDGGFGRYYGCLAVLFWFLEGWRFLFRKCRWKTGETLLFVVALAFLLLLIPIGKEAFPWIGPRILLVAWPIFLLFLGRAVFVLNKKPWIQKLVIAICLLGIVQDARVWAHSLMPHHYWQIKSKRSEFESYRYSSWYVGRLGPCTSELDIMTGSFPKRSTIFLAAPAGQFLSAPFYGRFLQTQIINFHPHFKGDPDFLVYLTISSDPLLYIGNYQKTLPEAISSEYKEIFFTPYGRIFVHPRLLKKSNYKNE